MLVGYAADGVYGWGGRKRRGRREEVKAISKIRKVELTLGGSSAVGGDLHWKRRW